MSKERGSGTRIYPGLWLVIIEYPNQAEDFWDLEHQFRPVYLGLRSLVDEFQRSQVLREYYHVVITGNHPPPDTKVRQKIFDVLQGFKPKVRCSVSRRAGENVPIPQLLEEALQAFAHPALQQVIVSAPTVQFSLMGNGERWHLSALQLPKHVAVVAPHHLDTEVTELVRGHNCMEHRPGVGGTLTANNLPIPIFLGALLWRVSNLLSHQQILKWYREVLAQRINFPINATWMAQRFPTLTVLLDVEYYLQRTESKSELFQRYKKEEHVHHWLENNPM